MSKKRIKYNKYKHQKSPWMTNGILKSIKYNKYFTNIGPSFAKEIVSPNDKSYTDYLTTPTNAKLDFKLITTEDVERIIDNFQPKPSTGHDNRIYE